MNSVDSDSYIERLYRISNDSFKKCGTSIMLINAKGDILYKILPISNYTEARFYQIAYHGTFNNSNIFFNTFDDDSINPCDIVDVNFLVKNNLISKIYGFFYVKYKLHDNDEFWFIVNEFDKDCSIAIGIENIIFGYKSPAIADIKLGLSSTIDSYNDSDIPAADISKYIDKWREIKSQIRNQYYNDPIKSNILIRQITAQMIGLPLKYHNYTTDEVHSLLKKWRQIQVSIETTQATLGLRICSMNFVNNDYICIDLSSQISKKLDDSECIMYIKQFIEAGNLSRIWCKIEMLKEWITRQNISFCGSSLLIVYDQSNLDKYDVKWIDFNYVLPMKDKKCQSCDINVLKGLKLITGLMCVR